MLDFMSLWDTYEEEDKELALEVRSYLDKKVRPFLKDSNRTGIPIKNLVKILGDLRLYAPYIEGYACRGASQTAYGLIMSELERLDSGVRSLCSVQGSLVMGAIYKFGSDKQKDSYLEKLSKGDIIGAFGLTEPLYGSDPGGMVSTAIDKGEYYELNGEKHWITNACEADIAIVWAKLDGRVRGFIVDTNIEGYEATKIEGKFSLRTSSTGSMKFKAMKLPKDALLEGSRGLKSPLSCLSDARFGIAYGAIGAAEDCYETALAYAKQRQIFEGPLARFQLVQAKLVEMLSSITKAQLITKRMTELKDSSKLRPEHISLAKMNNCSMALKVAREARDILGANGVCDDYPVMRHLINLETVNTYEGSEDVHRLVLGRAITGENAFF